MTTDSPNTPRREAFRARVAAQRAARLKWSPGSRAVKAETARIARKGRV